MALKLDITTLALMFITLAMTSFIVMFLIWRINRDMPGVLHWMVGTLLNTASAVTSLLNAQSGWTEGWGPFLGTTTSVLANMLVLEGARIGLCVCNRCRRFRRFRRAGICQCNGDQQPAEDLLAHLVSLF